VGRAAGFAMAAVAFALVCLKSLMWLIAEFSVFTAPVRRLVANGITPSGAQFLPRFSAAF